MRNYLNYILANLEYITQKVLWKFKIFQINFMEYQHFEVKAVTNVSILIRTSDFAWKGMSERTVHTLRATNSSSNSAFMYSKKEILTTKYWSDRLS